MTRPERRRMPVDLQPHEVAAAEALGRLPRLTPSAGLRERCLAAPQTPREGLRAARGGWVRSWSAAAGLLVALGASLVAGSSGSTQPAPHPDSVAVCPAALCPEAFSVVDDPSVPLFHGLETFQELAVLDMNSPGRGPR